MPTTRRFGLDEWLCAVVLALMTVIAFVNARGRYLFGYSLAFTEELTLWRPWRGMRLELDQQAPPDPMAWDH